jgi:hypothetical protein
MSEYKSGVQRCCYNPRDWGVGGVNLESMNGEGCNRYLYRFAWGVDEDPSAAEESLCDECKISVFGFGSAPAQVTLFYDVDGAEWYNFEIDALDKKSPESRTISWEEGVFCMHIHPGMHDLRVECSDPDFNIEAVRVEPDDETRARHAQQDDYSSPEGESWNTGDDYSEEEWDEADRQQYLQDDLENVRQQYNSAPSGSNSISGILEELGLSQYEEAFTSELGVTEEADLAFLEEEDLQSIGIKGPKARRLMEVARSM